MGGAAEDSEDEESVRAASTDSDDESIIVNFQFTMTQRSNYDENSLLIDTGPTSSAIKNPKMVVNMRKSITVMNTKLNGGQQISKYKADLPDFLRYSLTRNLC